MVQVDSPRQRTVLERLVAIGQEHLLEGWSELNAAERSRLVAQLERVDLDHLAHLVRSLVAEPARVRPLGAIEPAPMIPLPGDSATARERRAARDAGHETLAAGKVGIFLVAGGQGTRLRFDGPKGMYPVGPVTGRTLFQLFAERILALGRRFGRSIPWYIMTSDTNHGATCAYFAANGHFGLDAADVVFQEQGMLPVVDGDGKILMAARDEIVLSPDGHGSAVRVARALAPSFRARGIEALFYMQVDNPLIRVCDPEFIGHHVLAQSQFSSKAIAKEHSRENLGVFCLREGRMMVVEYSELPEAEAEARDASGRLAFRAGNLANHIIATEFLSPSGGGAGFEMPYHVAHKATPCFRAGRRVEPSALNSIKFESFIFDAIPFARNPIVVEAARECEYAPIKNLNGENSPESTRAALVSQYARWLRHAGVDVPSDGSGRVLGRIEISPLYAADADELAARLAGRKLEFRDPLVLA